MRLTPDSVPVARKGRAWETLQTVLALDPVEDADVGPYVLTGKLHELLVPEAPRDVRAFGVSPFALNIIDAVDGPQQEREDLPPRVRRRRRRGRPGSSASTPSRPDGEEKEDAMSTVGFYYQRPG